MINYDDFPPFTFITNKGIIELQFFSAAEEWDLSEILPLLNDILKIPIDSCILSFEDKTLILRRAKSE